MIDTHSHIYDRAFDRDRKTAVARALEQGVTKMLMPAIDSSTHRRMFDTARQYPGVCVAMMGLHPTSVNENPKWRQHLQEVERFLKDPPQGISFCAVGEVGLDLHWSREYAAEQAEALRFQIGLALSYGLPLVIHTREAWGGMCTLLEEFRGEPLRGVMHSFSGTLEDYRRIRKMGDFCFGIGGPVTYKKSGLSSLLLSMDIDDIVLETDAPYLPPVPYRGERNESGYLPLIRDKVAEVYDMEIEEVDRITTANARRIFGI